MTIRMKPRGGSTTELAAYIPQSREIVVDTTLNAVRVGDGTTAGGNLLTVSSTLNSSSTLTDPLSGMVGTIQILTAIYTDGAGTIFTPGLYSIVATGTPTVNSWLQISSLDGIPSFTTLPTTSPVIGQIIYLNSTDGTDGLYRSTSAAGGFVRLSTGLLAGASGDNAIARIVGGTYNNTTNTLDITSGTPNTESIFRGFISDVDQATMFAIGTAPAAVTTDFINLLFTGEAIVGLSVNDVISVELQATPGGQNLSGYSPPAEQVIGRVTLISGNQGTGAAANATVSITTNADVTIANGQQVRIHRVNVATRSTVTVSDDASGFQLHNVDASRYPNLTNSSSGVIEGVDNTPISWTATATPWLLARFYVVGQRVTHLGLEYTNATAGEATSFNIPGTTGGASVWTATATTDIDAKYLSSDIQTTTGNFFFRRSGTTTSVVNAQTVPIAAGLFTAPRYFINAANTAGDNDEWGIIFNNTGEAQRTTSNFSDYFSLSGPTIAENGIRRDNGGSADRNGTLFTSVHSGFFEARITYALVTTAGFYQNGTNLDLPDGNNFIEDRFAWFDHTNTGSSPDRILWNTQTTRLSPQATNIAPGDGGNNITVNHNTSSAEWARFNATGYNTLFANHGRYASFGSSTISGFSSTNIIELKINSRQQPIGINPLSRVGGRLLENGGLMSGPLNSSTYVYIEIFQPL